jgi:hypothetical protein
MKAKWAVIGSAIAWATVATQCLGATIPADTLVKVRLLNEIRSGRTKKGEQLLFEVVDAVTTNDGQVLIRKGATAVGTVKKSKGSFMFGMPGKLAFSVDYVKIDDKVRVPLKEAQTKRAGKDNTFGMSMGALLLGPLGLAIGGKEAKVPAGTEFPTMVAVSTEVPITGPAVVAVVAASPPHPTFAFDPKRASLIKYKSGLTVVGTVWELKDCAYTVCTELGQMQIAQEQIESITDQAEKK